jgi:O-antigen/teichoic acid export membrane protein
MSIPPTPAPPLQETPSEKRFAKNVLWNWAGVVVSLFTGFVLSPLIIRHAGADGYGIWALSFALVDYYWFLDFGFRSATVKYVAHYAATGEAERIGEVLSTSLVYAGGFAAVIVLVVGTFLPRIVGFFQVAPAYRFTFTVLLSLITLSWCTGAVLGLFQISLEAVQRFDITNRIAVGTTAVRAIAQAALLFGGFGLIPLGAATIGSQVLGYVLNFVWFRKLFGRVRISPRLASRAMLKQLGGFGIHSFFVTISTQLQNQSAPILIGHFLPAAFTGFYNLPMRLVQYTAEFVGRIAVVTNASAAALAAKEQAAALKQLGIYANRYSLVIFLPMAILLGVQGEQFLVLWVGPAVAHYSAQVLPILLAGYVIAVVGQLSSGMLLIGMGRHQGYARGMVTETVLGFVLLPLVIPRWGIVGAAWVGALLMIANRGCYLAFLTSQALRLVIWEYAAQVYVRPLLSAIPAAAISVALKRSVLPGTSWVQIALAAAVAGLSYYPVALFFAIDGEHRRAVFSAVRRRLAG